MSAVGVSLSAGGDGGQRSGPVPAEASLAPVEKIHTTPKIILINRPYPGTCNVLKNTPGSRVLYPRISYSSNAPRRKYPQIPDLILILYNLKLYAVHIA